MNHPSPTNDPTASSGDSRSGPKTGGPRLGPREIEAIARMVGDTPLLKIHYRLGDQTAAVYTKYESENMTGSIKDRMAIHTLRQAITDSELQPGATIVEASSGNTGISFAAIGAALGHPVRIYMPNWMSHERVNLIRSFGAEIIPVSRAQGGFVGAVQMAEQYAQQHVRVFLPRQFDNVLNIEAHQTWTGPELVKQMESFGQRPHAFVAGVGTGGSVMGIGRCLRTTWPDVRVHPLEPANSPTLRTGVCVGQHRIQGISDEFVPSIVDLDELDEVIDVWDGDAILMAQMLCRKLGLAVGISSGANLLGAIRLQQEMGPNAVVATLFPDSNKKYLSTDLCKPEPERDDYLAPQVELLGLEVAR